MEAISCFIPLMVFSLSSPSVSWTMGSRRIFSVCLSLSSSLEVVVIVSPFFVLTVMDEMRCRCVSGSVSGLSKLTRAVVVRVCLLVLPSSSSPVNVRFFGGAKGSASCDGRAAGGGIGSAGRCCAVEGDVANGTSVMAPPFVDLGCFSACGAAAGS